ncbi:MAG TPA: response regulator [Chryseosolibacter sp.]
MTILLVDNDRNQHERFREMIRRIDPTHSCLKAFSTESALNSLQDGEITLPDLIFLDLEFRAGEGKQMLRYLKRSATLKNIPVCIYTNVMRDSDHEATQTLGAIGYIVKEANLTNMLESIRSVIKSIGASTSMKQ